MIMLTDFKKFILRGNTIDLAVAFVIGAAFNGVVQSLVKDLITPFISALGGKPNFASLYFTLHHSRFLYGEFINNFISFLLVATAVFFLVIQPINKLVTLTSRLKSTPEPTDKKCLECLSSVPIQATRCAFCGIRLTNKK